jgi:hypothetical protein
MGPEQLDSVIRIADAVDRYGALVLAFAAFLFIGMMAILYIMRRYQNMAKDKDASFKQLLSDLQAQNQVVFHKLMDTAFKTNPPEIVPESITTTGLVREQLKHAAAMTKADRVSVYSFHNGQRMMNGRHMIKVSCWAEYAMLARFSRIDKHKDVPVAKIQDICAALLVDSRWEVLTEDDVRKTQLESWDEGEDKIKSAFAHSILSTDGIIIGFVLMEYLLAPVEHSWVENARSECKKLGDKVSIVLDSDLS